MSFDVLVSLQDKIKLEIKAKQEEQKEIDNIFKQKEIQTEKKVNNEFKLILKKLEAKISLAHKELTGINAKLNKFAKSIDHINLGDLKRRKSELNISVINISKRIKGINKERAKVLKDKQRELLKEKKGKIKQLTLDLKKLSQQLENEEV